MAVAETFFGGTRFRDRIAVVRGNLLEMRRRRMVYNRTSQELHAMSERELTDLGFNRSDIPRVAWQSAYGPSA